MAAGTKKMKKDRAATGAAGNRSSSPFDRKRPLTRKGLVKFEERVLLHYAPAHLKAAMDTLLNQAMEGNMSAVKMILQMHNMIPAPGTISLTTNIQNNVPSIDGRAPIIWSFDSMVRHLDEGQRKASIVNSPVAPQLAPPELEPERERRDDEL